MKTERIALFPGSFDPFTNGHLNTVVRASRLFDQVIIGIFTNTTKNPLFSPEEKKELVESAIVGLDNVRVTIESHDLTVTIAKSYGADFLIRGVRNGQDYEYEKNIAFMNKQMAHDIETVVLFSDEAYGSISSTMIKEIAKFKGDISHFVPDCVNDALKNKYSQE